MYIMYYIYICIHFTRGRRLRQYLITRCASVCVLHRVAHTALSFSRALVSCLRDNTATAPAHPVCTPTLSGYNPYYYNIRYMRTTRVMRPIEAAGDFPRVWCTRVACIIYQYVRDTYLARVYYYYHHIIRSPLEREKSAIVTAQLTHIHTNLYFAYPYMRIIRNTKTAGCRFCSACTIVIRETWRLAAAQPRDAEETGSRESSYNNIKERGILSVHIVWYYNVAID